MRFGKSKSFLFFYVYCFAAKIIFELERCLNLIERNFIMATRIGLLSLIFIFLSFCAAVANETKSFFRRFDPIPEFYAEQDVKKYFNHKNSELREMYLISANSNFEALILSFDSIVFFGIIYNNYLGMGRQNAAILFDPRESDYSLIPYFEFRHKGIFYQIGLDHSCLHEIDRQTRPTLYWNKPYIKVSSANYRFKQYKRDFIDKGQDGFLDNFKWAVYAGYYVRKFGNVERSLINGGHSYNSIFGLELDYSFYKTKNWMFSGNNLLFCFADTSSNAYWTNRFGLSADVYSRKNSLGFFINSNFEFPRDLPHYSKDKLFEWGMRFRF